MSIVAFTTLLRSIFQKYGSYIFMFLSIFVFLETVYLDIGIVRDNDYASYLYMIEDSGLPDLMRPIVYPLILQFAWKIEGATFVSTLFTIQVLLLTCALLLVYKISRTVFTNKSITLLVVVVCLLNAQTTQFINRMSPEMTLLFFTSLFVYFFIKTKDHLGYIFPMILSLTALTFTKPIFLYFPIPVFIAYLFLQTRQRFAVRSIGLFALFLFLLYVMPVFVWSYSNKIKDGYFTFSNIRQINTIGKLIQYDLIDRGPEMITSFPVKTMVLSHLDENPYELIETIIRKYQLSEGDQRRFQFSLYQYGEIILKQNLPEFLTKSLFLIPSLLKTAPSFNVECPKQYLPCYARHFIAKINNFFAPIASSVLLFFLLAFSGNFIRYCIAVIKNKLNSYGYLYIALFTLLAYYLFTASMGTYDDQILRIFTPIYFEMTLLIFMTSYDVWRLFSRVVKKYMLIAP